MWNGYGHNTHAVLLKGSLDWQDGMPSVFVNVLRGVVDALYDYEHVFFQGL
jgi:hypothetical protein